MPATIKKHLVAVFRNTEKGFNFARIVPDTRAGWSRDLLLTAKVTPMGVFEVQAPNSRSARRRAKELLKRQNHRDVFGQPIPEGFGYEFVHTTPEVVPVGGFIPGEMHGYVLPDSSPMPLRPEVQEAFNEAVKEFAPALERLDDSQKVTITTGFEALDKAMEGGIPVGTFSGRFSTQQETSQAKLGPTQQKIMDWAGEWCRTHMDFTKAQVIDCLNLSDDSARKSLKRLVDAGLIVKEGDSYNLH